MDRATTLKRCLRRIAYAIREHPRLSRVALAMIPDVEWTLRLDGIGPMRIRLRRHRYLWLRGPTETDRFPFEALRTFVGPGDTVVDGGANIGLYARFLVAHGAGAVIAFEPWGENLPLLSRNLELGGITERVTVMGCALSERDGIAAFQVDDVQTTSGTLDEVTQGKPSEGRSNLRMAPRLTSVSCRRLDSMLESGELPPPAVIKLDVEGAEALVLAGAVKCLERHAPRLVIELHGAAVARQVMRFIGALGYRGLASVQPAISTSGVAPMDERLADAGGQNDVLFVAASRDPRDIQALAQRLAIQTAA